VNFAAHWARNSGRATPSLRCTPNAQTKETRQEATYLQREAVQTSGATSVLPGEEKRPRRPGALGWNAPLQQVDLRPAPQDHDRNAVIGGELCRKLHGRDRAQNARPHITELNGTRVVGLRGRDAKMNDH